MKPKSIVTVVLLLFVGASVVALAMKSLSQSPPAVVEPMIADGVVVYYFHGKTRCVTCNTIESYANQAVESNFADQIDAGLLQWKVVNFELSDNEHFAKKYELIASSVVLARIKDGSEQEWKNLDRVWELVGDKESFLKYVEEETRVLLDDFNT